MGSQKSLDSLNDPLLQQLFRIFSFFADLCPSGTLTPAQAHFILAELQKCTEQPTTSRDMIFGTDCVTFRELLTCIEAILPERQELEPAAQRLFERLIAQVLRQGYVIYKKQNRTCATIFRNDWKTAWLSVMPGKIELTPVHKPSDKKTIPLDERTTIIKGSMFQNKHIMHVTSGKHKYTFGHPDKFKRNAFAKDMETAISYRTQPEMAENDRRIAQRTYVRNKDRESSMRHALEAENARLLEVIEEGKRSLRDEEIVRSLAARMLAEERDRNEQLVMLLQQYESQLRLSNQPENTTITVDLEKIEEEGLDEVQVIEQCEDDKMYQNGSPYYDNSTPQFESEGERTTPYDDIDEPSAVERARRERELYLITSTQSI